MEEWDAGVALCFCDVSRKRKGSDAHRRYESYKRARTVGEFYELGGTARDLQHDYQRGLVKRRAPDASEDSDECADTCLSEALSESVPPSGSAPLEGGSPNLTGSDAQSREGHGSGITKFDREVDLLGKEVLILDDLVRGLTKKCLLIRSCAECRDLMLLEGMAARGHVRLQEVRMRLTDLVKIAAAECPSPGAGR